MKKREFITYMFMMATMMVGLGFLVNTVYPAY